MKKARYLTDSWISSIKMGSLVYQDGVEGDSRTISGTLQDLPGTAQGCWFLSGVSDTYPEDPHLALVHSNIRPARAALSVGNSIPDLDSAAYEFLPETSGLLNRDFRDITPNAQIDGFQIGQYAGIIIVQMPDAETLWIEALRSATADPPSWAFTDDKTVFER